MEPLMSYEGYLISQDLEKSRELLNNYYIQQGYVIINTQPVNNSNENILTIPSC